jgi:hypothetical protein
METKQGTNDNITDRESVRRAKGRRNLDMRGGWPTDGRPEAEHVVFAKGTGEVADGKKMKPRGFSRQTYVVVDADGERHEVR